MTSEFKVRFTINRKPFGCRTNSVTYDDIANASGKKKPDITYMASCPARVENLKPGDVLIVKEGMRFAARVT